MNPRYGTNRKIGVGFNYPRVLGGQLQYDWRRYYALMRRVVRKRSRFGRSPSSLIQALGEFRT